MEKDLIIGLLFGLELLGLLLWGFTRLTDDLTAFLGSWDRLRSAWRQRRSLPDGRDEERPDGH